MIFEMTKQQIINSQRYQEWIKQDRAWWRPYRIAHARYEMYKAIVPYEKAFWKTVLEANED